MGRQTNKASPLPMHFVLPRPNDGDRSKRATLLVRQRVQRTRWGKPRKWSAQPADGRSIVSCIIPGQVLPTETGRHLLFLLGLAETCLFLSPAPTCSSNQFSWPPPVMRKASTASARGPWRNLRETRRPWHARPRPGNPALSCSMIVSRGRRNRGLARRG